MEADGRIANASLCNVSLQSFAIKQAANPVLECLGLDQFPPSFGQMFRYGTGSCTDGGQQEDDHFVNEMVEGQPTQEFGTFFIIDFCLINGRGGGRILVTGKVDKGTVGMKRPCTLPVPERKPVTAFPYPS